MGLYMSRGETMVARTPWVRNGYLPERPAVSSPSWQAMHLQLTDCWARNRIGHAEAIRVDKLLRAREAAGLPPPRWLREVKGRIELVG